MQNFNDIGLARKLVNSISKKAESAGSVTIMEVCGTHTMAIGRFGIRKLLPDSVNLVSGPGCPVCVTPAEYIDNVCRLALEQGPAVATFGDMVRVPGCRSSLEQARSEGADVRVVTNPLDILAIEKEVIFLAVGFETTAAPIAAAASRAYEDGHHNISMYTSLKVIPPTLELLAGSSDINIDGFILPGHVSAVIGADAYSGLAIPGAIAGFEMIDILNAVNTLLEMRISNTTGVKNCYSRAVIGEGNQKAVALMERVFQPCSQPWRGMGVLEGCSLKFRPEFERISAEERYGFPSLSSRGMPEECSCGEVLKGVIAPDECALFADTCTPDHPVGPCMVSSEGSCAAFYRYERKR